MKISEMTREDLAERLILSVKNSNEDQDFLLTHPHIIKGSFALVCCLYADKKDSSDKELIVVDNEKLNSFGISKSEMFDLAIENSNKLFPVTAEPLEQFYDKSYQDKDSKGNKVENFKTDGVNLPKCLLLSNNDFFNGAAAMFYQPDILKRIADKLNCEELYLVPFSKDVVFCVSSSRLLSLDEVKSISADFVKNVEKENRLIGDVMVYDSLNNLIKESDGVTYSASLNENALSQSVSPGQRSNHR